MYENVQFIHFFLAITSLLDTSIKLCRNDHTYSTPLTRACQVLSRIYTTNISPRGEIWACNLWQLLAEKGNVGFPLVHESDWRKSLILGNPFTCFHFGTDSQYIPTTHSARGCQLFGWSLAFMHIPPCGCIQTERPLKTKGEQTKPYTRFCNAKIRSICSPEIS